MSQQRRACIILGYILSSRNRLYRLSASKKNGFAARINFQNGNMSYVRIGASETGVFTPSKLLHWCGRDGSRHAGCHRGSFFDRPQRASDTIPRGFSIRSCACCAICR